MKERMMKLLLELLKDSKRSDRELAKILGVSQPTITRLRHKLEKNGMIQNYTIVPDFKKMGFEILALTFVKISAELLTPEVRRRGEEYAANWHNALFVSVGEGLGMNIVAMTIHRDYTEFHRQLNQVRLDLKDYFGDIQSFIIPFGEVEFKRLSFAYLGDIPL